MKAIALINLTISSTAHVIIILILFQIFYLLSNHTCSHANLLYFTFYCKRHIVVSVNRVRESN